MSNAHTLQPMSDGSLDIVQTVSELRATRPRAIAEALITLDQDEALRERLIAEGRKRLECFSWSNCAQATLEVYREIA